MNIVIIIISFLVAYLSGSIPTGYLLVKKLCGIDIRTMGSGNIGSTNVKRVAGSKISILTQVIDILKGFLPVALGIIIYPLVQGTIEKEFYLSLIALSAILGHNFTPFLGFNGGKGVNTTLGAFVLITPLAVFSAVAVYFMLRTLTSIVSIRSLCLGLTLPVVSIISGQRLSVIIITFIAFLIMVLRHKENIQRLINKEEN